jgi:hypothetical protein
MHLEPRRNLVLEPQRENTFQDLRLLVPEHHREHLVVDKFLDAFGNLSQQFFAIEDRGQLVADLVKQR